MAGNKTLKYHERKLLEKIEKICSENIHAQNFGVIQLAEKINISERQFYRIIKELTGLTPYKFILEIKLQAAREIVETGYFKTAAEIALSIGFKRSDYFSKLYQRRFHTLPK